MEDIESRSFSNKFNISMLSMTNKNRQLPSSKKVFEPFGELLKRLTETKSFGVSRGSIELIDVRSSHGNDKGDRFYLSIPYAHQNLKWTVLFNASCPEMSPDFEFSDKSFLADPSIELLEQHVPTLINWNRKDPDALLKVITELVLYYKEYQISRLRDRLQIEYSSLLRETEIATEDVELIHLPDSVDPVETHFAIRLAIDFKQLPGRKTKSENDAALLLVTFYGLQWNEIVPKLCLSASLQEIVGNQRNMNIPPFPPQKTLMDYVPEIKCMIDDKVNAIVTNFNMKKAFIGAVLCQQGGSIIEYDAIEFSSITLLLNHQDFHFLLHINLSKKFPEDPPKYTMQSIYYFVKNNELVKNLLPSVKYSPRWESTKMVYTALNQIMNEYAPKFKNASLRHRH